MTDLSEGRPHLALSTEAHESPAIQANIIVWTAIVLSLTVLVIHVVTWFWFVDISRAANRGLEQPHALAQEDANRPLAERLASIAHPRLEAIKQAPAAVSGVPERRLYAAQEELLRSYGWVDREHRIIRIPIDRAMAIMVEKGMLPAAKSHAETPARRDVQQQTKPSVKP
jgi:hypothetical protein